ncbi:MAG: hypothetical protein U1F68_06710 [Gammaproteobacteria bacterium]
MNAAPTLYLAVAEPLVEPYRLWLANMPSADAKTLREALTQFPKDAIGAYQLDFPNKPDYSQIAFRTGTQVNVARVQDAIQQWCGTPPQEIDNGFDLVPLIDSDKLRAEFRQALQGQPYHLIERIGLTLPQLQRDLAKYKPDVMLLVCHGTPEGCVLLEDGRGGAEFVAGGRLLAALKPSPQVLLLSACHSEQLLKRAKFDNHTATFATVYVEGAETLEVTAAVRFGVDFLHALARGETAGAAYDEAKQLLINDANVGDFATLPGKTPPSAKLRIHDAGRAVVLKPAAAPPPASSAPPHSADPLLLRRRSGQFIGRRRELWQILDMLLGKPAGIGQPDVLDRRLLTLTQEGDIGKTTLALQAADWCRTRGFFPGGVLEVGCETLGSGTELLGVLLDRCAVPPDARRGDLLALLAAYAAQQWQNQAVLLLLDNLDDLTRSPSGSAPSISAAAIVETLLGASPTLRILPDIAHTRHLPLAARAASRISAGSDSAHRWRRPRPVRRQPRTAPAPRANRRAAWTVRLYRPPDRATLGPPPAIATPARAPTRAARHDTGGAVRRSPARFAEGAGGPARRRQRARSAEKSGGVV